MSIKNSSQLHLNKTNSTFSPLPFVSSSSFSNYVVTLSPSHLPHPLQQKWTMVTKPFITICPYFVTEYIW